MKEDKNPAVKKEEDADISLTERSLLDESIENSMTTDDLNLKRSMLDNTDRDGTPLNEGSSKDDQSGDDLDIPGSEADDDDEMIGEEDEENNNYSQADTE
ncbi:hypothetical protein BH11BAC4_BH11BAC4_04890 [soil metagenome]